MYTLLGRQRKLPDAVNGDRVGKGHALRAAINTPIQGGAADIAMLAMLRLSESEELKRLEYRLLMQARSHGRALRGAFRESGPGTLGLACAQARTRASV